MECLQATEGRFAVVVEGMEVVVVLVVVEGASEWCGNGMEMVMVVGDGSCCQGLQLVEHLKVMSGRFERSGRWRW